MTPKVKSHRDDLIGRQRRHSQTKSRSDWIMMTSFSFKESKEERRPMASADRIDSLRECRNNFPPQANANAGRRRMAPTSAPRRSASDNCARNYPYSTIDLCLCVCVCVCVSTTAEDRERERRHETQSEASFIFGFFWLPFSFRRRRQRRWWLVFSFIGGDNHRRRRVGSTTRR